MIYSSNKHVTYFSPSFQCQKLTSKHFRRENKCSGISVQVTSKADSFTAENDVKRLDKYTEKELDF